MASLLWRSRHSEQLLRVLPQTMILRQIHGREQIILLTARSQAKHGRCVAATFSNAPVQRFDQDARQAGRQRKPCKPRGHGAACSKLIEQQLRALDRRCRRSFQPVKILEMREFHGSKAEQKLGEIATCDFRSVVLRSQRIVFLRIEADHLTGHGAAGSAGSLHRGGLADAADLQGGKSRPRRVGRVACQTAVDDRGHSFDGHGAFSNIRRQDELPLRGRQNDAVLLRGR